MTLHAKGLRSKSPPPIGSAAPGGHLSHIGGVPLKASNPVPVACTSPVINRNTLLAFVAGLLVAVATTYFFLKPDAVGLAAQLGSLHVCQQEACGAFAKELNKQGVITVEDIDLLTDVEARDLMARAGMSVLQQHKILGALQRHRQAAAAARIVGKPNVFDAARSGDIELVKDHFVADAGCVLKATNSRYDCLFLALALPQPMQFCSIFLISVISDKTALMYSSMNGHLDVTRFLVESGANLEAKDNTYYLPTT